MLALAAQRRVLEEDLPRTSSLTVFCSVAAPIFAVVGSAMEGEGDSL